MRIARALGAGLAAASFLAGCATVPEKGGFDAVEALVDERLGKDVYWSQGTPEDAAVEARVAALVDGRLSLDAAVQIALLNHRSLQARYEDLGVAQADLVQAGLLHNPVFFASVRFPDDSSLADNVELEVAQDFLDLFTRSARKRAASLEFEEAKLRVAGAVLEHAAEVKAAYYELQGSLQTAAVSAAITRAAEAAYELARRQHAAGNLNELDLAGRQGLAEQAKIELAVAEAAVLTGRERLRRLLGLAGGDDDGWTIADRLPPLPPEEAPLERLEALALERRLDLQAARLEVEQLAAALKLTLKWRWVAVAEVGVSTERESDGLRVTGPNLQIELPIFDQGQARIARLEALNRQSRQQMMGLAVDLRSEVREAHHRVRAQRRLAEHYERVLIPVRERIVEQSQRHYNYMLIGAYRLLEAKQDEIAAYRAYVEAVRDYWLARTDLEAAVGGALPAPEIEEPTPDAGGATETATPDAGEDRHRHDHGGGA